LVVCVSGWVRLYGLGLAGDKSEMRCDIVLISRRAVCLGAGAKVESEALREASTTVLRVFVRCAAAEVGRDGGAQK
jgi:hypothetical protein